MDIKSLSNIQTRFWCQSILDILDLKNLSDLKKLQLLSYDHFVKKYKIHFKNEDLTKAFEVFCSAQFDPKTWAGYFNGTPPTKKNKGNKSSYEIIGELLPLTMPAFSNGAFNIIKILTAGYIKDAIKAFAQGVTELYDYNNLEIELWEVNLFTNTPEVMNDYKQIFESNLSRGHFKFCFDFYIDILNRNKDSLGENIHILQLAGAYINSNYFGESYKVFSRLLIEGKAIQIMNDRYNIPPYFWKKSFPVIRDALSHYSVHKDELFWIEENELFLEGE